MTLLLSGSVVEWFTAVGIWATLAVYVVIAYLAGKQLIQVRAEARDRSRPYIVVDTTMRSVLVMFRVRNLGRTAAKEVRIDFDEAPGTTMNRSGGDWQDTILFESGVPSLAPAQRIEFHLDAYNDRANSDLPMVIRGFVNYADDFGNKHRERFIIDLRMLMHSAMHPKGLPDIERRLREITKGLDKLTREVGRAKEALISSRDDVDE